MTSISSAGIGSGLDVQGIVNQLIDAEFKSKESELLETEAQDLRQVLAYKNIQEKVQALQKAAGKLSDPVQINALKVHVPDMTGSQPMCFTATADAQALPGNHTVLVNALAQGSRYASDSAQLSFTSPNQAIGHGALEFTLNGSGGASKTVSVTIDQNHATLSQLVSAVNVMSPSTGVSASLIQKSANDYTLSFVSTQPGMANSITGIRAVADPNSDPSFNQLNSAGGAFNLVQAASDAVLTVDGISGITRSSNVIDDVIPGVTLSLLQKDTGSVPHGIRIQLDTQALVTKAGDFVESYNQFVETYAEVTHWDPLQPDDQQGPLYRDSEIKNLKYQIDSAIGAWVHKNPMGFNGLAQIGIQMTTEQTSSGEFSVSGKLDFNQEVFNQSLALNPKAVTDLFSANPASNAQALRVRPGFGSDKGVASRLSLVLNDYLSVLGQFKSSQGALNSDLQRIKNEKLDLTRKIEERREELRMQFSKLDALLGSFKAKSSQLRAALQGLETGEGG